MVRKRWKTFRQSNRPDSFGRDDAGIDGLKSPAGSGQMIKPSASDNFNYGTEGNRRQSKRNRSRLRRFYFKTGGQDGAFGPGTISSKDQGYNDLMSNYQKELE